MRNSIWLIVCLGLMTPASVTLAAPFNRTGGLINTPTATFFNPGEFDIKVAGSVFSSNSKPTYEMDYAFNFALTDQFKFGLTYTNSTTLVGNVHYTFFKLPGFVDWKMAGGVENISGITHISSFDDFSAPARNNLSPFIVNSFQIGPVGLHAGFGKGRFEPVDGPLGQKPYGGVFGGVDYDMFAGKIMADFDGQSANFGYQIIISPTWEINVALTEIGQANATNANTKAPVRFASFGLILKENFFEYRNRYIEAQVERAKTQLDTLDKLMIDVSTSQAQIKTALGEIETQKSSLAENVSSIKSAIKQDLKFLDEKNYERRESLKKDYIGTSEKVSEKVLQLYYLSFENYYQKNYIAAIENLTKATALDPYFPALYIRLGAIYYELNMMTECQTALEKAARLDPNNADLKRILQTLQAR